MRNGVANNVRFLRGKAAAEAYRILWEPNRPFIQKIKKRLMKERLIAFLRAMMARMDDSLILLDSDWLEIFTAIQRQVNHHLRAICCEVSVGYRHSSHRRDYKITISLWNPETHNHDLYESATVEDELMEDPGEAKFNREQFKIMCAKVIKHLDP